MKKEEPPKSPEQIAREEMIQKIRATSGDPFKIDAVIEWKWSQQVEIIADCQGYCVWIYGGQIKHYGGSYASPFTNLQAALEAVKEQIQLGRSPGSFEFRPLKGVVSDQRLLESNPAKQGSQVPPSQNLHESPTGEGSGRLPKNTEYASQQPETD